MRGGGNGSIGLRGGLTAVATIRLWAQLSATFEVLPFRAAPERRSPEHASREKDFRPAYAERHREVSGRSPCWRNNSANAGPTGKLGDVSHTPCAIAHSCYLDNQADGRGNLRADGFLRQAKAAHHAHGFERNGGKGRRGLNRFSAPREPKGVRRAATSLQVICERSPLFP